MRSKRAETSICPRRSRWCGSPRRLTAPYRANSSRSRQRPRRNAQVAIQAPRSGRAYPLPGVWSSWSLRRMSSRSPGLEALTAARETGKHIAALQGLVGLPYRRLEVRLAGLSCCRSPLRILRLLPCRLLCGLFLSLPSSFSSSVLPNAIYYAPVCHSVLRAFLIIVISGCRYAGRAARDGELRAWRLKCPIASTKTDLVRRVLCLGHRELLTGGRRKLVDESLAGK